MTGIEESLKLYSHADNSTTNESDTMKSLQVSSSYIIRKDRQTTGNMISIYNDRTVQLATEVGDHIYSMKINRSMAAEMIRDNLENVSRYR